MVRVCEGTHCHPVSHLFFPVTCATSKHPNLRGELSNFRQQTARHAQGAINLSETASSQPHTPHSPPTPAVQALTYTVSSQGAKHWVGIRVPPASTDLIPEAVN